MYYTRPERKFRCLIGCQECVVISISSPLIRGQFRRYSVGQKFTRPWIQIICRRVFLFFFGVKCNNNVIVERINAIYALVLQYSLLHNYLYDSQRNTATRQTKIRRCYSLLPTRYSFSAFICTWVLNISLVLFCIHILKPYFCNKFFTFVTFYSTLMFFILQNKSAYFLPIYFKLLSNKTLFNFFSIDWNMFIVELNLNKGLNLVWHLSECCWNMQ